MSRNEKKLNKATRVSKHKKCLSIASFHFLVVALCVAIIITTVIICSGNDCTLSSVDFLSNDFASLPANHPSVANKSFNNMPISPEKLETENINSHSISNNPNIYNKDNNDDNNEIAQKIQNTMTTSTESTLSENKPLSLSINNTWYPSDEWVQDCTQDLSVQNNNINGEWDIPFDIAIGDCIKFCRCYHRSLPDTALNKMFFKRSCPLERSDPNNSRSVGKYNVSIIDEIHEKQSHYPNFTVPEPEALVIHLRLGDIIETTESIVEDILKDGASPGYLSNNFPLAIKSIHELLDNIHTSNAETVHIVGGSHKKQFWRKSRVYAGCIHRAIQTAGYNVTMNLEGRHPDQDFYYMSHASQLVVSAGGFSNLMGQLVEHRGGKIIGRSFGVMW
jgi:hypothetical protein